jgi:Fur family ferric uptake transcriptional regulator
MGIIDRIVLSDGQARYQFKSEKQNDHHHLICTECGKIIDYNEFEKEELGFIKKAERRLSEEHQFIIIEHKIEFLGICTECQLKKNMENEGS